MKLENVLEEPVETRIQSRRNFLGCLGGIAMSTIVFGENVYAKDREAVKPISVEYWARTCVGSSTIAGEANTCYYVMSSGEEYVSVIAGAGVTLSGGVGVLSLSGKNQLGFTIKLPKASTKEDIEKAVKTEMNNIAKGNKELWKKMKETYGSPIEFKTIRKPEIILYVPYRDINKFSEYLGTEEWNQQLEQALKQVKKNKRK